jgi:hypothetical protein
MNKIIRAHYPASQLPEDLRVGVDPNSTVTVIVSEEEEAPDQVMTLEQIFSLDGFRRRSGEEIDSDIRRMRDEWND